jgi:hypothetical protein
LGIGRLSDLGFWTPKARTLLAINFVAGLRKAGMPED